MVDMMLLMLNGRHSECQQRVVEDAPGWKVAAGVVTISVARALSKFVVHLAYSRLTRADIHTTDLSPSTLLARESDTDSQVLPSEALHEECHALSRLAHDLWLQFIKATRAKIRTVCIVCLV